MRKTSIPRGVLGYLGWLKARGHASPLQATLLDHAETVAKRALSSASKNNPANRERGIRFAKELLEAIRGNTSPTNDSPVVHDGEPRIRLKPDAIKL